MDRRKAYKFLIDFFESKNPRVTHQKRGFMDAARKEIPYKRESG
jgi:hypothetical protein